VECLAARVDRRDHDGALPTLIGLRERLVEVSQGAAVEHGRLMLGSLRPASQKSMKDVREAVSDRGRDVRSRGDRPATRAAQYHGR
jgi:hypothetical protein